MVVHWVFLHWGLHKKIDSLHCYSTVHAGVVLQGVTGARLLLPCTRNIVFLVWSVAYWASISFSQRANFSLRVSVMKAKNLMAKDANGETFLTWTNAFLHKIGFICQQKLFPPAWVDLTIVMIQCMMFWILYNLQLTDWRPCKCQKTTSLYVAFLHPDVQIVTFHTPRPLHDRIQRSVLHAGNPGGSEPSGSRGEEGEKVQLQKEEGKAGETLQHQGGVTCQVYPGDWGQTRDSQPSVGRALCVVSTR